MPLNLSPDASDPGTWSHGDCPRGSSMTLNRFDQRTSLPSSAVASLFGGKERERDGMR